MLARDSTSTSSEPYGMADRAGRDHALPAATASGGATDPVGGGQTAPGTVVGLRACGEWETGGADERSRCTEQLDAPLLHSDAPSGWPTQRRVHDGELKPRSRESANQMTSSDEDAASIFIYIKWIWVRWQSTPPVA